MILQNKKKNQHVQWSNIQNLENIHPGRHGYVTYDKDDILFNGKTQSS